MSRTLKVAAVVIVACVVAAGALAACAGWGAAGKSLLDRLLPGPSATMWAQVPAPDAYSGTYSDATGAGTNYVYDLDAVAASGAHRSVTIISFGAKASGQGFLEIEVRGTSGIHYDVASEEEIPAAVREALVADGGGA